MKIFKLVGHTAWIDWGSGPTARDIEFYMTRESAQKKIKEIKKDKHWRMSWTDFQIIPIEVQP